MKPPDSYAETPEGLLLIANGEDAMSIWDGLKSSLEAAGVIAPAAAPTLSASGSGTITGDYFGYVRFVTDRDEVSDLSPISARVTAASSGTITYTNVPVSAEAKVVRRQILRNTAGQADTFYVDVETADLVLTSFASTQTDALLAAGEAVPLLDADGRDFANRHAPPPAHKAVVAHHLGRMFAAAERDYARGGVKVTNGSTTVTGIDTDWPATFAGRFLYVVGATRSHEIAAVDTSAQTLTLAAAYAGATDPFGVYAVRPAPAQRRLLYWSEANLPQSWPATNALALQEDGDEITGLMPKGSFLYVLGRRHVYRFTFQSDPGVDGFMFLSSGRGCVNQRCWLVVEDTAFMLDELGVHAFTGESESVTAPVQGFWDPSAPGRINWAARDLFHAAHSPGEEAVRWFVCLSGEREPRHALCYNYRLKRWWVEEYPRAVTCSTRGALSGQRRVFLGSQGARALLHSHGTLDGPDPAAGTTAGAVTGAGPYRLTDAAASFPGGVAGWPVVITGGRGKGQWRLVAAVEGTTLHLRDPWLVVPDATSAYRLGGVPWAYAPGWFRWLDSEENQPRRLELLFGAVADGSVMRLEVFRDFRADPVVWRQTRKASEAEGVAAVAGESALEVDLSREYGQALLGMGGRRELTAGGPRFVSLRLAGCSGAERQAVYQLALDSAAARGGA